jgi:methionyl-tRNA formyltransferase
MKFIFAGTSEFGIPTLEKLMVNHELLFVITQPDKPAGRKKTLSPSPIKVWAEKNNIRFYQPAQISELSEQLKQAQADILLVAAYGQIIPQDILDIPKHGSVNIHGSILPKYRGASPIQSAILNGDKKTGITLIKIDEKMDHGPIITVTETDIVPTESFNQLYTRLAALAAETCVDVLPKFISGEIGSKEQDHSKATFSKKLTKEDGRIDWTNSAQKIYNQIRALNPEPGTWTTLDGKIYKILEAQMLYHDSIELPGKIYKDASGLAVKAVDSSLEILKLQPEGGKSMTGKDFLNGLKDSNRFHFV